MPVSYAVSGAIVDFGAVTIMFAVGGAIITGASLTAMAWGMAGLLNHETAGEPAEVVA